MLDWHAALADYIRSIDAHHHLVNTSTGSYKVHPDLYGPASMDLAEIHFYYVPGCCDYAPSDPAGRDIAGLTYYYASLLYGSVTAKPGLIGEWGLLNESWTTSPFLDFDGAGIHLHHGFWSSLMSGMASTGLIWYWDEFSVHDPAWWFHYAPIAAYFNDISIAGLVVLKPFGVDLNLSGGDDHRADAFSSTNPHFRVMGLRNEVGIYGWIQNKEHTWWNDTHGLRTTPQSGTVTVYDLVPGGKYILEMWDTYAAANQVISRRSVTAQANGTLKIEVSALQSDVAFKLYLIRPPIRGRFPPTPLP